MYLDMADNINDLSQIIQSINSNEGILQNISSVCRIIGNLQNLNQESVNSAKDNGTHLKNFCNQALKPILVGLQTVITEANGLSTDNLGTGTNGLSGKVTSINNNIKTIVNEILGLTNSNDKDNPSPFQVANGETESKISKAINAGQTVKQALGQLKGSVNKINVGLTDFQTAMDGLTIPEIDTNSTDTNSLGYKLNTLQIASNNIIDAILGFKNGNTTSSSGENAVEIKLADRVKDVKAVSGQISAFSKALYEKKQGEGESSTGGVGLIPNLNSFNTNLGDIQEFKIDNIISKENKLSNKITDSVIAANSINTWLNTTDIGAWNDTKQALNAKINHIKAAGGVVQNLANSIFKEGAQATEAVMVNGEVISPAVPAGKDTGLYVNLNSLLTATNKYDGIKTSIQGLYAQGGLLTTIPNDINEVFGTLGNGTDDNDMTFMKLATLAKDSYEDKIKKLKDVGKVLDKYKFALWKDTFVKDEAGKDTNEIKSEGLLKTVSDFNGFLTSANVKATLDILQNNAQSITKPLDSIPAGIKAILNTLTKYSEKEIGLLDLETITTYEYVKSETSGGLERKEKGKKTDIKAAGLVGKVIAASAVIKKYAAALENPTDKTKGLFADLNQLKNSLDSQSAKSATAFDDDKIKFLKESLPSTIKSVLESLDAYGDDSKNEFLKLLKETEDVGGQQKTKAEARVKRLQDISKIIKTYATTISKDDGTKGLVADLSSMNNSMLQVQALKVDQIDKKNFDKIENAIVTVTDVLVSLGEKYNKDSGKRLQKSLEGLIGYKTINKDDKGNAIVDEKGKATTTSHTGIFAVIGTFSKALQAVFKGDGTGTFEILSKINFDGIDQDKIKEVFKNTEQLMAIVITSLKKQTVESDETRLIVMYGAEYIQHIQTITSCINTILGAIIDMIDPKKNPLIAKRDKVKEIISSVESTFGRISGVVRVISVKMQNMQNDLGEMKIEEIGKSYTNINNVFQTVKSIISIILDLIDPKKNPLVADRSKAKEVISSVESTFGRVSGVVRVTSVKMQNLQNDLSEINLKDIVKVYEDLNKIFNGVNSILATVLIIIDPQKNPFIGRIDKIQKTKYSIILTFIELTGIIQTIKSEMQTFAQEVESINIKDIEESYERVNKIFQSVNNILTIINDMVNPKKNPLIHPLKLLIVKGIISHTFDALAKIIVLMLKEMQSLNELVETYNLKQSEETIDGVNKVFTAINNILKSVIEMPLLMLKFFIAAPIVIIGLPIVTVLLWGLAQVLKLIRLIKFDKIAEDLANTKQAFESLTDIFKQFETLVTHLVIAAIIVAPAITASLILIIGLAIFSVVLKGLAAVLRLMDGEWLKTARENVHNVTKVILSLVVLTLSIIALAVILKYMPEIGLTVFEGLGIIFLITAGIGLVIWLMSLVIDKIKTSSMLKIAGFFLLVALICGIFLVLSMILVEIQERAEQIDVLVILAFLGGMIALAGAFAVLGYACTVGAAFLAPAVVGIMAMVGALLVVTAGLLEVAEILVKIQNAKFDSKLSIDQAKLILTTGKEIINEAKTIKDGWTDLDKMKNDIDTITNLMVTTSAKILMTAKALNQLQKIELDSAAIGKNIANVFATANDMFQIIKSDSDPEGAQVKLPSIAEFLGQSDFVTINKFDPSNIKKYGEKFNKIAGEFNDMFDELRDLVKILNDVQTIKLDEKAILSNIQVIFQSAYNILQTVEDGITITNKETQNPISLTPEDIKNRGKEFRKISNAFEDVFDELASLVETLNESQTIRLDEQGIKNNIDVIFNSAVTILESFNPGSGQKDSKGNWIGLPFTQAEIERRANIIEDLTGEFEDLFDELSDLIEEIQIDNIGNAVDIQKQINTFLGGISGVITEVDKIVSIDISDRQSKVETFASSLSGMIKALSTSAIIPNPKEHKANSDTLSSYCKLLNRVVNTIDDLNDVMETADAGKSKTILTNYSNFLQKVQDTDLKKLETSAKMFKEMAKFSESINGNFDKMAETLNEKISPLLEDLKNTLGDVKVQVTESNEKTVSDRTVERQEIYDKLRASGQTQNLTIEEVDKRIDSKYRENVQQRYGIDEITSKLAELINLFQNGEAVVKTT